MQGAVSESGAMELTWYGRTCVRLRGKDAVVVADPYQSVVGPTGRGITGDIVTFSHPDDRRCRKAKGKPFARRQDAPAVEPRRRVRPRRARRVRGQGRPRDRRPDVPRRRARAPSAASSVAFVVELDGIHTIHLGDIGHLLTEEKLGDIGAVDIACVPLGGTLSPTKAAALIAQLDPKIVVPMPLCEDEADCAEALAKFFHEMGAEPVTPAEAVGDRHEPAGRDDDRPAGVARQAGLTAAGSRDRRSLEDDPPALDHRPDEVRARPVRDLARRRHAPDRRGRPPCRARASRSRPRAPSARAALIVTAASASSGRHPQVEAGERHRQRQARRRRRAGIEVGADRDRHAARR